MPAQRKYPEELRERAVKMVFEVRDRGWEGPGRDRPRVGRQLGVHPDAARWVRQAEVDGRTRLGTATEDSRRIRALDREVRELRRRMMT